MILISTVYLVFVEQLFEYPPTCFHEVGIHRLFCTLISASLGLEKIGEEGRYLVIIFEVNPVAQTFDCMPRFRGILHNNRLSFLIVLFNAHLQDCFSTRYTQYLLDFVLNRNAVCIPSKPASDTVPFHRPISRYDIFDCGGE